MKASVQQQLRLLDLQALDTEFARVCHQLRNIPQREQAEQLETAAAPLRAALLNAARSREEIETEIERIESDLALIRQRKERDEAKLAQATTPKQTQALSDELEALAKRQLKLEDAELTQIDLLDTARAQFTEAQQALDEHAPKQAAVDAEIRDTIKKLELRKTELSAERELVAAEISRELYAEYESIRQRTGIGAARLRGNVSEASNMALDPGELRDILARPVDEVIFDPQTGAILVRVED